MADPDSTFEVAITDGRGRRVRAPGLAAWVRRVAPHRARGTVAIALVSDGHIRSLNRTYRGKDAATDVLSFPADPAASPPQASRRRISVEGPGTTRRGRRSLGDIAIAKGVARRQARAAGHSYAAELKVLALHGVLHLLGYDHEDPADAGRMARLERRLRAEGGLRSGLIERGQG